MVDIVVRRRGRLVGPLLLVLFVAGMPLASQESPEDERPLLELLEALEAVVGENVDIQRSRLSEMQAQAGYDAARASIGPRVELDLEPYSIDQRRVEVPGEPEEVMPGVEVPGEQEGRTSRSQSTGGTLRFSQSLPSGGRITGDAGLEARVSRLLDENGDDDDPSYEVEPSVGLQFSQPVFVNGRFIDLRVGRALDGEAAVGVRNAEVARRETENGTALAAIELYFVIGNLRDAIETLEFSKTIQQTRIEELESDVEVGIASERQLLQARLAENRTREALLQSREQLRTVERSLNRLADDSFDIRAFSLERVADYVVADDPLSEAVATLREEFPPDAEQSWDLAGNSAVRRADISIQEAVDSAITSDVDRAAELSVVAQMSRRYPDDRDDESNIGSAFTDLFDGDGGFNWRVSLGVRIPLFDGGQRRRSRDADELAIRLAEIERGDAESDARDELGTSLERLGILTDRIAIIDADRAFEFERLEDTEALREIGSATALEVDDVRLDIREREDELREVQLDLLLTLLEVESTLGGQVLTRLDSLEETP